MSIDPGLRRLTLRTLLAAFPGPSAPEWSLHLISEGLAGLTLFGSNVVNPVQVSSLTGELRAVRHDVLLAIDEEAGDVTRLHASTGSPFPGNAALGTIDDPQLTHDIYQSVGSDLATLGLNLNLAPTADVNTTSENPIIGTRAFSADPAITARHTAAATTGLQSTGVAACAKHFPGHGSTTTDSHTSLPTVPLSRPRDLPPFQAAIEAGTQAIMTAHIRIPTITGADPATFSPAILRTLLRHDLAFTGAIVTDALSMAGAIQAAGTIGTAATRSLSAGADLLCLGRRVTSDLIETIVEAIATAVTEGDLPLSRLENAAHRTATLAAWAGRPPTPKPHGPTLGLEAARRAIHVEGTPTGFTEAVLIQLDTPHSVAEGSTPWGLAPLIKTLDKIIAPPAEVTPPPGRPLIIVGRRLHQDPAARNLITTLTATHRVAVVEMGWPSPWRPAGATAFITTSGATQSLSQAAAEALTLR
ncbi:glycoside hydrolase family 3 protein [Actinoplanes sp. NPDC049265]|uniref:glycoside hydrolase family 3 protein n=1 Tax=Actinoplanes sp. NPDC049265 TaxID=3363902 RepID=UPI003710A995